jgi:hypothetical protein
MYHRVRAIPKNPSKKEKCPKQHTSGKGNTEIIAIKIECNCE